MSVISTLTTGYWHSGLATQIIRWIFLWVYLSTSSQKYSHKEQKKSPQIRNRSCHGCRREDGKLKFVRERRNWPGIKNGYKTGGRQLKNCVANVYVFSVCNTDWFSSIALDPNGKSLELVCIFTFSH